MTNEISPEIRQATRSSTIVPRLEAPASKSVGFQLLRLLRISLVVVAVSVFLYLLVDGWDYYTTSYSERPRHEDYREFRPAGSRGLAYGYIGSAMMILMLTYSLRKRTRFLGKLLKLRAWLNFHIFLGAFGPLLILLHTSFKVQGLIAVAFWSMVAVALSGYLGRFLYQQIPRSLEGDELTLAELEEAQHANSEELVRRLGVEKSILQELDNLESSQVSDKSSTFMLLVRLLLVEARRPILRKKIRRRLTSVKVNILADADIIVDLAVKRLTLKRRVLVLERVHRLFHYWHVIHKPFAIIMYLIMMLHIGVAVWTGYTWIF